VFEGSFFFFFFTEYTYGSVPSTCIGGQNGDCIFYYNMVRVKVKVRVRFRNRVRI
jgi:hypothetical protein